MFNAFGGGHDGVVAYLQTGQKQGRKHTRDELDDRVKLSGDIDHLDRLIQSIDSQGERYGHYTLSFAEDAISPEMLEAINGDFRDFITAAYEADEIYYYAEAHIPRLKTVRDADGVIWNRKPHIHAVVPYVNLVTGQRASPLEMLNAKYGTKLATWELADAFQEHINKKYGLVSPKDRPRFKIDVVLSRKREGQQDFTRGKIDVLQQIQDRMLTERIETPEAFRAMLATIGEVGTGKRGRPDQYFKVTLPGETRAVRLDFPQFSEAFIRLPTAAKFARLSEIRMEKFLEAGQGQVSDMTFMAAWEQRAKEIKYFHPDSNFFKEVYVKASQAEKLGYIAARERYFYQKLEEEYGYRRPDGRDAGRDRGDESRSLAGDSRRAGGSAERDYADAIGRNLTQATRNFGSAADAGEFAEYARGIDAQGLAELAFALEYRSRFRGIGSGEPGADGRELNHGHERDIADYLRAAGHHFGAPELDRGAFEQAALANRTNLEDALTAARIRAYPNERLNSVYLRTTDELKHAARMGDMLLENPAMALNACTATQSVFSEKQLEQYLLKNTADAAQYDAALTAVLGHADLVIREHEGEREFSTRQVVEAEARLEANFTTMASTTLTHKVSARSMAATLAALPAGRQLNEGQVQAFEALCSGKQLAIVNGSAGVGKSYVLAQFRKAAEADGFTLHGALLQGKTAEDLQRDSGIKSQTMHGFLAALDAGRLKLDAKSIVVVDEAGMVGSAQYDRLMRHVTDAGARVRLVGDVYQLSSVEYGDAFRVATEKVKAAGGALAEVKQIVRQNHEWQREASMRFAQHDVEGGLAAYAEAGCIKKFEKQEEAQEALVARWMEDRLKHPGKSQLVLAATNDDVSDLNARCRAALKAAGQLQGERQVRAAKGEIGLAAGDEVMFLKNDSVLGVKNGTGAVFAGFEKDDLRFTLADGKKITVRAELAEITHAYAVTTHKSQGVTVDRTYELGDPIADAKARGVNATRHREDYRLFYAAEKFPDQPNGMVKGGILVEQGEAPYEFEPGAKESHFVRVIDGAGKERVLWGVDLPRSIDEAQATHGDMIDIRRAGKTKVTVTETLPDGTQVEKEVERNTWETKVLEEKPNPHQKAAADAAMQTSKAGHVEVRQAPILLAHGAAPYQNKEGGSKSYFVTTQDDKGKEKTVWGKDLERALEDSGAQIGDHVDMRREKAEKAAQAAGPGAVKTRTGWSVTVVQPLPEPEAVEVDKAKTEPVFDPDDHTAMITAAGRVAKKEFSHDESRQAWSAVRDNDSVLGQLKADYAAEKLIAREAQTARFKEIRDNLDAARVLDYARAKYGLEVEKHHISRDDRGYDVISCGSKNYHAADFLTKHLHLPYKLEAGMQGESAEQILKECYKQQLKKVYIADRSEPVQDKAPLFEGFKAHKAAQAEQYQVKKAMLVIERDTVKAKLQADDRAMREIIRHGEGKTRDQIKADLVQHRAVQSEIMRAHTAEFREKKLDLDDQYKRPQAELYKEFVLQEARQNNDLAVHELRRIAVTGEDKYQAVDEARKASERAAEAAANADAMTRAFKGDLSAHTPERPGRTVQQGVDAIKSLSERVNRAKSAPPPMRRAVPKHATVTVGGKPTNNTEGVAVNMPPGGMTATIKGTPEPADVKARAEKIQAEARERAPEPAAIKERAQQIQRAAQKVAPTPHALDPRERAKVQQEAQRKIEELPEADRKRVERVTEVAKTTPTQAPEQVQEKPRTR